MEVSAVKLLAWILNLTMSPATPDKLMKLQKEPDKRNRISPQALVHVILGSSYNSKRSQATEEKTFFQTSSVIFVSIESYVLEELLSFRVSIT